MNSITAPLSSDTGSSMSGKRTLCSRRQANRIKDIFGTLQIHCKYWLIFAGPHFCQTPEGKRTVCASSYGGRRHIKETLKDFKHKRPKKSAPMWLDKGTPPLSRLSAENAAFFFFLRFHQVLPLLCSPPLHKSNTDKTICVTGCENTVKSFLRAGVAEMRARMKRACSRFLVCWAL